MPVWATAAAKAATKALLGFEFSGTESLQSLGDDDPIDIPITSAAVLAGGDQALAITYCSSSVGVDLTRNLEVWAFVSWRERLSSSEDWLKLISGNGVGVYEISGEICISDFALALLKKNLDILVPDNRILVLEIVLPRGRELAKRTSNEAFGVVDGLALIGEQAEIQVSASPYQLKKTLQKIRTLSNQKDFKGSLVFVIGENGSNLFFGMDLAEIPVVKVGNWLGPLIVAAAESGVNNLLLFGYHGKLIKLAGGIFHTHHHLADARIEILMSLAVCLGLPLPLIQDIRKSTSIEAALHFIESYNKNVAHSLWLSIASEVEERSIKYLANYGNWSITIGVALFDKQRQLRWAGPNGIRQLSSLGHCLED